MRLLHARGRSDSPIRRRGRLPSRSRGGFAAGSRGLHAEASGVRFAASAAIFALAAACGADPAPEPSSEPEGTHVEAVTLAPQLLVDEAALTGQLEAEHDVLLQSEISGVVRSVAFVEGQRVEEGHVLFVLRDAEQAAELRVAEAELALVRDVFERVQQLTSRDIQSQARRAEARARLDQANAEVALAKLELERTRIRAPFAGVTGIRRASPGQRVEPDDPLVSLAAIDRLQLVFTTQEYAAPLARIGMPIHVRVAAWPGERFPGEVFFVSPRIDPATRRLVMKAWVANGERRLKPGMFANVDVEVSRKQEALVLPESAIVYDRNGVYAWVVGAGEKAQKVPISIGLRQKGRVEVLAGLSPGDRVVTAGTHKLKAGDPVVLVPPAAATARHPEPQDAPAAEAPGGAET